tara:strand:- start:423 stop:902 length:480 start_codon:yes stop_codon:yes gene_type:complete
MNKWRTRDITVYTRLPDAPHNDEGGAYQVMARKVRCFGQLAVHPLQIVDYTIKDKEDPSTWEVEFGHESKDKRWKLTHWPTGLTFSSGIHGYGYKRKSNAMRVAEQIDACFGDVLRSLPSTGPADAMVDALMNHLRFDDLRELKHKLEKKYGIDRVVKD